MPEQYGFGDYATEPTRLCQSNKGGDQMNQKDDEVAHCGNDIKTRQALDFGPLLEFAMNTLIFQPSGISALETDSGNWQAEKAEIWSQ
jgi:hypothetical protein